MSAFYQDNKEGKFEEDDDSIYLLSQLLEKRVVAAGEPLVRQGESVSHLYILHDSSVSIDERHLHLDVYEYWNDDGSHLATADDPTQCEWSHRVSSGSEDSVVAQPFWSLERHWCSVKVKRAGGAQSGVTFLALHKDRFERLPSDMQAHIKAVLDARYTRVLQDWSKTIAVHPWSDFASRGHSNPQLTDPFVRMWEKEARVVAKQGKVRAIVVVGTPDVDWYITRHPLTGLPLERTGRVWMAVEYGNDGIYRLRQGHWIEAFDGASYTQGQWGGAHLLAGRPTRIDPRSI